MIQDGFRSDPALASQLPMIGELLAMAVDAAGNARAPYSFYPVGAAVLDDRGAITGGCNIESAAFAATLCAERAAIGAALSGGARGIRACATVTRDSDPASCCGVCRQLLAEFGPEVLVINASLTSDRVRWGSIVDWLPFGFGGASLGRGA